MESQELLSRIVVLGGKAYKLHPPRAWALDILAQYGIDYLNPRYTTEVLVFDAENKPVMEGDQYKTEVVPTSVPPSMSMLRFTAITLAALLTQEDGLDENKQPVHVWTPEEVLEIVPIEAADAIASACADLVNAAFKKPEKSDPTPRRRARSQRGGAKRSS